MGLKDDLNDYIEGFLGSEYSITRADVIPDKSSLTFGATAKELNAVIIYIDMRGSRKILSDQDALASARVHKSFLHCLSKCIRKNDGFIRSFGGDSVIAFFKGDECEKRAVKAAMNCSYAISNILNPLLKKHSIDEIDFGIGISKGDFTIVKSGVSRNEMYQDLVWIGWPLYHALEYSNMAKSPKKIWISKTVFNAIKDDNSMRYSDGKHMWFYKDVKLSFGDFRVYITSYHWSFN